MNFPTPKDLQQFFEWGLYGDTELAQFVEFGNITNQQKSNILAGRNFDDDPVNEGNSHLK